MARPWLIVTCEHASNRVPAALADLFANAAAQKALHTHRGVDFGAAAVARAVAKRFAAPLFLGRASRLVVDLNRSRGHARLFSEWTKLLPPRDRDRLLERWWLPYREAASAAIAAALRRGRQVWHLSVHSFTPVLAAETRLADIGLLYDPKRWRERLVAERWRRLLADIDPGLRVRQNYPYNGWQDGFVPALRREFRRGYVGVEIEMNQAFFLSSMRRAPRMRAAVLNSIAALLADWPGSGG